MLFHRKLRKQCLFVFFFIGMFKLANNGFWRAVKGGAAGEMLWRSLDASREDSEDWLVQNDFTAEHLQKHYSPRWNSGEGWEELECPVCCAGWIPGCTTKMWWPRWPLVEQAWEWSHNLGGRSAGGKSWSRKRMWGLQWRKEDLARVVWSEAHERKRTKCEHLIIKGWEQLGKVHTHWYWLQRICGSSTQQLLLLLTITGGARSRAIENIRELVESLDMCLDPERMLIAARKCHQLRSDRPRWSDLISLDTRGHQITSLTMCSGASEDI